MNILNINNNNKKSFKIKYKKNNKIKIPNKL